MLKNLIITGALEWWLLEAQHRAQFAVLTSGIRSDTEPRKAERWLGAIKAWAG